MVVLVFLVGDNWRLIQVAVINQLPQTERGYIGPANLASASARKISNSAYRR
jgi:hypothetical protein